MPIKIEHDKPNCIGCGACAAVCPDFWEMEGDKSHLKGSKDGGPFEGGEELEIKDSDEEKNMEAARSCPVNVIHLKAKDGKQLI
ncbi:MAG: ferredoxin [Candidatus Diapherotrites archaeon]|uniref:Ferredoxin n=1 Tax=Candidatus Iainarchaeum sp. TaxID=3101447 RepID=A0A8T4L3I3_9ARCH|nr:ferredoxin [Candidatus Diapherotrites archaeon]